MRNVNCNVLSAGDSLTTNGIQIDANQLVSASFHMYFGDSNAAGTLKLQVSNDVCNNRYNGQNFTVTNWTDLPNQSAAITSGAPALLTVANMTYRWIRAVYTSTATGVQTVVPIADTGVKQVETIDAVADVAGSLNNTYFLLSSINVSTKAQKNFYVWFDDGAGVDPALPGKTGIQVVYTDDDTADTIATAARAAIGALSATDFATSGSGVHIVVTNAVAGPCTAAADGAVPTGFAFANTTPGVASNLLNKYFLINNAGSHHYYVWMNVDGIGTDPALAGKTGIEVAFSSGASAATIGGDIATALTAVASGGDFSASGTTTVTVTNVSSGPFTPASAGTSGFTFAITAGGTTTVNVNLNALGV